MLFLLGGLGGLGGRGDDEGYRCEAVEPAIGLTPIFAESIACRLGNIAVPTTAEFPLMRDEKSRKAFVKAWMKAAHAALS